MKRREYRGKGIPSSKGEGIVTIGSAVYVVSNLQSEAAFVCMKVPN